MNAANERPPAAHARVLAALAEVEVWAEREARSQAAFTSTPAGVADPLAEPGSAKLEGAASAYLDVAARMAHLRAELAAATHWVPAAVRDAFTGELAWANAERDDALAAVADASSSEEQHARGRASALAAIRLELRSLVDTLAFTDLER